MRFFRVQKFTLALSLLAIVGFAASTTDRIALAQSMTTGALSGVVADSTGAVVPGATVVLIDPATGAKQTVTTNQLGRYTAQSLKPGVYKLNATADSLKSDTMQVTVILGTTATADIQVTPTGSSTVVEVRSADLPLVDSQNVALADTFSEQQIQQLPTPGGDVTTVAYTAPGVVMNAGGGGSGGNFSSDGLPGISNLFVLNGFDNQDPFMNLNSSGSSNLSLGQGELADATVIQNAYNSQYGRAAGAIISYTTKSGGNRFHGEALYNWNGTVLNANGWFNNATNTPRPHAVSNEWALNAGGPIIKDKVFFFSDWEGLRYVLPSSGYVSMPSPQYEAYAMANVPSGASSIYNQMFALYNGSPVHSGATPVATGGTAQGGCGDLAGTQNVDGQTFGVTDPCALSGYAQANSFNKEWLYTQRFDYHVNDNHNLYGRFKVDHGTQPTSIDLVNPAFNTFSSQPEYEGQFNDAYTLTPNLVNALVVAGNWYQAYFGPNNIQAAQAVLPFWAYFNIGEDGSGTPNVGGFTNLGVPDYFPQGRNVTQYQLSDDLSWTHGKHSFKFGANFRRDLVSDYDEREMTSFPALFVYSLNDIAQGQLGSANSTSGGSDVYQQAFTNSQTAHLALYNLGVYMQDDWQVSSKVKFTLGMRADRTGNPLCHGNCFSLYNGGMANSLQVPYSSLINQSNAHPYGGEVLNMQPRFGFNYEVDAKTGIRGGIGLFADLYPAGFLDSPIENFPNYNLESVYNGVIAGSGAGVMASAATANNIVQQQFPLSTGTAANINAALQNVGVPFTPPNLNAVFSQTFHEPQYVEYSLQIQRQLTKNDGISLTYAGNYGYNEVLQNPFVNASSGTFNSATGTSGAWGATKAGSPAVPITLGNLPNTPPNQSFGQINAYTNDARSNYNGGMVTYTHQGHGLTAHATYTYSHTLDDVSNGGLGQTFGQAGVVKQLTPSLAGQNLNYSNADYDIRNNLSGDFVYEEPFKVQNKILNQVVSGWMISGKTYYRSGEPFSVNNTNLVGGFPTMAAINNTQGATSLMPQLTVAQSALTNNCISMSHAAVAAGAACLDSTQYNANQTTFGNLRRNVLYGPHYADTDANLTKQIVKTEGMAFTIGAQAYNIANHVNFNAPGVTLGSSNFGAITTVQAPPTSPYGSFQGAAITQRVLVVSGKLTF